MKKGLIEIKSEISSDIIEKIRKKYNILDHSHNLILIETDKEWDEVGNYIVSIVRKNLSSS